MDILMPRLGETVTDGTISRWFKSAGDTVVAGEPLFEIETDKTSMEVEAIAAGVLRKVQVSVGETVAVGSVVAILDERAGHAAGSQSVAAPSATPEPQAAASREGALQGTDNRAPSVVPIDPFHGVRTPVNNFGKATLASGVKVTPLARRLAAEGRIDLAMLQGSGPGGRVRAADVRAAALHAPSNLLSVTVPISQPAGLGTSGYRVIPLDSMRKTVARRLTESKQHVPHFYVSSDIQVDSLLSLRKQLNAAGTVRLTVNDLVVKAYAVALQDVPEANVTWAGDRLLQFERSDVGVAVALPGGLVTPVVHSADTKSLVMLSQEIAALAARAKERRLQPQEYTGGTATVTNLGMYGVQNFQAIVNPPQATILAVGAAAARPCIAHDGKVAVATLMTVCISVDHRAVDGALAGQLLTAFRKRVENPFGLVL